MAKEKKELVDKLSVNAADRSPLLRAQKETYLETQANAAPPSSPSKTP